MSKEENSQKDTSLIKKSLDYSVKESAPASIMESLGNNFVNPFAIAMKATSFQIGLLTAIPNLVAPLSQLHANKLIKKISRKEIVVKSILIQSLIWLPIALIPFLLPSNLRVWILILLFSLCFTAGNFLSPAWHSWMGDLVSENKRGEYFGRRNKIATIFLLTSSLAAAWFLKIFNKNRTLHGYELILIGFSILFILSFISRLISNYFIKKQYEPDFKYDEGSYFSIMSFLKRSTKTNFGNFSLYNGLLRIAICIAGPFFAVYMLRDLKFSYPVYISMSIASSLASIIFLPVWGKLCDKYGSVKILKISGIAVSIMPIMWLFSPNWIYLLFVNAFGGLGWAGFNLSCGNFIFENVRREKRAFAVAYYNILIGIGIFIGSIVAGLIIPYIPIKILGNVLLTIFLASGILRLIFTLIFSSKIKEKRIVEEKPVLEIIGIDIMKGIVEEVFVSVNNALPRSIAIKDALEFRKNFIEKKIKKLEKKVKELKEKEEIIKEKLKKS